MLEPIERRVKKVPRAVTVSAGCPDGYKSRAQGKVGGNYYYATR
ncbi:hypothetical protein ES706_04806 [subsurface metagenome]